MSAPRTVLRALRASSSSSRAAVRAPARAFSASRAVRDEAAAAAAVSPKIASIVDSVQGLTLLEVSELVSALKTRLNITEVALPAAAAAPAAGGAAAAPVEEAEKPKEKTIFTLKLEKIDAAAKAKIIREVKGLMPNMNLVEAKKFVESVPQVLKENVPKEEAEALMKKLQDLGATVSMS